MHQSPIRPPFGVAVEEQFRTAYSSDRERAFHSIVNAE